MSAPVVVHLPDFPPIPCPCGQARRSLMDSPQVPFSLHLTEISQHAESHFHRNTTEVYVVLECQPDSYLEIAEQKIALRPLTMVLIPPGASHRLVGEAKVLIVANPKFDVADEFLANS